VRAAYSSASRPSGVGPGNVPVFIERSADVPKAVQDILTGKCFDNGTICASSKQSSFDAPIEMAVREQFKAQGAYFLSQSESGSTRENRRHATAQFESANRRQVG
jgi:acetaldehyde dehydrogenase (acetylating)